MKRGLIILITLLSIPIAFAQEITLLNQTFSLVLILPIFMLILGLLFFGGLILKDNWENVKNFIPKFGKRKNIIKDGKKIEPKIDYFLEFKKFESKFDTLELSEAFHQLNGLLKDYISSVYEISHEFTHEELKQALKGKDDSLIKIHKKISDLKYTGKEVNKEIILKLLGSLKSDSEKHRPKKEPSREQKIKLFLKDWKNKLHPSNYIEPLEIPKISLSKVSLPKFGTKELKKPKPKTKVEIKIDPLKSLHESIQDKLEDTSENIKENLEGFHSALLKPFNPIKRAINRIKRKREIKFLRKSSLGLINKASKLISKDVHQAEALYSKALGFYYKLPIKEEEIISTKLFELYDKIEETTKTQEEQQLRELIKRVELTKKSVPITQHHFLDTINDALLSISHLRGELIHDIELSGKRVKRKEEQFIHDLEHDIKLGIRRFGKRLEGIGDDTSHRAKLFLRRTGRKLEDFGKDIEDSQRSIKRKVKGSIEDFGESIEDTQKEIIRKAKHDLEGFGENIEDAQRSIKRKVKGSIEDFGESIEDSQRSIKRKSKRAQEKREKEILKGIKKVTRKIDAKKEDIHDDYLTLRRSFKWRLTHTLNELHDSIHLFKRKAIRNSIKTNEETQDHLRDIIKKIHGLEKHGVLDVKHDLKELVKKLVLFEKKINSGIKVELNHITKVLKELPDKIEHHTINKEIRVYKKSLKPITLENPDFLDKLHYLIDDLEYSADLEYIKLKKTEAHFLETIGSLIDHVRRKQSHGMFKLKTAEIDLFNKSETFIYYIKQKEKIAADKLDRLEKRLLKSLTKKEFEMPKPRRPSRYLLSLKNAEKEISKIKEKITKEHFDKIMKPIGSAIVEVEPIKEIRKIKTPRIKLKITVPRTEEFNSLNKEEKILYNKINKIEKDQAKRLKEEILDVMKPNRLLKKKTKRYHWEILGEQVRSEISGEIKILNREERKIHEKLSRLL